MRILTRFIPPRWSPAARRRAAPAAAPPPTPASLVAADRALLTQDEAMAVSERRSSALRTMFPLLFSRSARRSDLWHAIVIERYLSDAANLADLEQRICELQQRRTFS